jgi:hypothetical protein
VICLFTLKGEVKLGFQPAKKNNNSTFTQGVAMGYNSLPFQGAFNKYNELQFGVEIRR